MWGKLEMILKAHGCLVFMKCLLFFIVLKIISYTQKKNTPQKYSDLKKETFKMSLAKNLAYLIKLYIILIIKAAEIKFSVASDPLNWNMWKTLNGKGTCNWCSIWVTILIYMRTKPNIHGYNSYQNGTCEFVIKCHQNMPVFLIFSKLSFLKQVLNQYIRIFG